MYDFSRPAPATKPPENLDILQSTRFLVKCLDKNFADLPEPVKSSAEYFFYIYDSLDEADDKKTFRRTSYYDKIYSTLVGYDNIYETPYTDEDIVCLCIGNSMREIRDYNITSLRHKYRFSELVDIWMKKCPEIRDPVIRKHMKNITHHTSSEKYVIDRHRINPDLLDVDLITPVISDECESENDRKSESENASENDDEDDEKSENEDKDENDGKSENENDGKSENEGENDDNESENEDDDTSTKSHVKTICKKLEKKKTK